MHILIAPTSFKGSLSARDAAEAIERGVRAAAARLAITVTTDLCPVADGGEGTAEILAQALHATARTARVTGPLDDEPIGAIWHLTDPADPGGRADRGRGWWLACQRPIAIFDSAQVVGLPLIPQDRRDPTRVSTRGIGELIGIVRKEGARTIVIGLGGTASVDGGIGAASALGWSFHDHDGAVLDPLGAALYDIARIVPPEGREGTTLPAIIALTDVVNPLCGPTGAARTFGPQKGATPEQVERLERGLVNLARRARKVGLHADPGAPGSGAAGGLGFGLAAFLGARVRPGAPAVLDVLGMNSRLARAQLVVTGEGRLDDQTAGGKAISRVAETARGARRPVLAIVGDANRGAGAALGLSSVVTLVGEGVTRERAESEAAALLERRAQETLIAHLSRAGF